MPMWHYNLPPQCVAILTHTMHKNSQNPTHTTHNTQPFYGSVEFVQENPGEPVPEETFTPSNIPSKARVFQNPTA